ncbi:Uncharacterized protein HZ326_14688 [Fusarium oxysporum f. sp. albedinis]|nr:Uncharacterized protein HZ326_14688 [Fusarium oxysporum f. sp. albedinis]
MHGNVLRSRFATRTSPTAPSALDSTVVSTLIYQKSPNTHTEEWCSGMNINKRIRHLTTSTTFIWTTDILSNPVRFVGRFSGCSGVERDLGILPKSLSYPYRRVVQWYPS